MATMTLAVPDELKEEMDKMKIINWSAVAREAFQEKIKKKIERVFGKIM